MVVVLPVPFTPTTKITCGCAPEARAVRRRDRRDRAEDSEQLTLQRVAQLRYIVEWLAIGLVPYGLNQFTRGAHAKVRRQQRVLKQSKFLRVEPPVAAEELFDARGNLRARLADGFFQPVEERWLCLVFAKQGEHGSGDARSPVCDSSKKRQSHAGWPARARPRRG